ncbi:hypothetical protein EON65_40075 [archaeon]|nr:MAG: hypothetical protein EON65_40075 [archaeon]
MATHWCLDFKIMGILDESWKFITYFLVLFGNDATYYIHCSQERFAPKSVGIVNLHIILPFLPAASPIS